MDSSKLACGDALTVTQTFLEDSQVEKKEDMIINELKENRESTEDPLNNHSRITPQTIESNESKLKRRIAECKGIIEALKSELNEEKARLEKETKRKQIKTDDTAFKESSSFPKSSNVSSVDLLLGDFPYSSCMFSASVDSKLNYDENLIEYEKQLQKYQNTLNMAQNEKKNAIRKQMLTKAFRLKLLEVENQCNIELLRVKQSLQCLEPLKIIASKWKTNTDDIYDANNFEFIPRFPELNSNSGCDLNCCKDDTDNKTVEKPECGNEDDNTSCD